MLTTFAVLARPVLAQDDSPAATSTMSLFFASLAVVAVICLIVGWENPKRFKFALGDKATTPFVRGGFGAAILVFGFLGQSLDPGRSSEQIAANERRVARSEARLQDARQREQDAKERERKAQQNEREARKKERDAANRQRQVQKEVQRAQSQAEAIEAQNVRAEEARKQQESDRKANDSGDASPKPRSLFDKVFDFEEIHPDIFKSDEGISMVNTSNVVWSDVVLIINPTHSFFGGFQYKMPRMAAGAEVLIPYEEFTTTEGKRFNIFDSKILSCSVRCRTPTGKGGGIAHW